MTAPPAPGSVGIRIWNLVTRAQVAVYRASGGRVLGTWKGRAPLLLLDHVGRRSGISRTIPLAYLRDGDDFVIVASRGGSTMHPAWFHNLTANPDTTVQVGRARHAVTAAVAEPAERERLWPLLVAGNPDYAGYAAVAGREVPVLVLAPRAGT